MYRMVLNLQRPRNLSLQVDSPKLTKEDLLEIFKEIPLSDADQDKLLELFSKPPLSNMTLDELMEILSDLPLSDITAEEMIAFLESLVPMANIPKTGDNSQIWMVCALASGAGLVWLGLRSRKRKEEEK